MLYPLTPTAALAAVQAALTHPDMGVEVRLEISFVGGPGGHPWMAALTDPGCDPHAFGHGSDPTSALIALASNLDEHGCDRAY